MARQATGITRIHRMKVTGMPPGGAQQRKYWKKLMAATRRSSPDMTLMTRCRSVIKYLLADLQSGQHLPQIFAISELDYSKPNRIEQRVVNPRLVFYVDYHALASVEIVNGR